MKQLYIYAFVVLVFTGSCSKKINEAVINNGEIYNLANADSLKIVFLGTACFLINYKENSILTDPFISNPPLRKVLFGKIYPPDTTVIFDFISPEELNKVDLLCIGHAHYDHLLDLPPMMDYIPENATMIGSRTAHHIVASETQSLKQIIANDISADLNSAGTWIYTADSSIRVMAVTADHPPHLMGITLYGGSYEEDLNTIPRKTKGWKMGKPYCYLIDYLKNDRSIAFRIWFQSSGSEYPLGFFPEEVMEGRNVDIAILSIATDSPFEEFPDKIISLLKPEAVILAHWENFWRSKYKPVKTVQKGDPEKLYYYLKQKWGNTCEIILPLPGSKFQF